MREKNLFHASVKNFTQTLATCSSLLCRDCNGSGFELSSVNTEIILSDIRTVKTKNLLEEDMIRSIKSKTNSRTKFRILGVVLALAGMATTSFGFSLRVVRPFPILAKASMSAEQKLQQFYSRQRHQDPMLPA